MGGTLCYSTCSLNVIEDEAVVAQVLRFFGDSIEIADCTHVNEAVRRTPGLTHWDVGCQNGKFYKTYEECMSDVDEDYRRRIRKSFFDTDLTDDQRA